MFYRYIGKFVYLLLLSTYAAAAAATTTVKEHRKMGCRSLGGGLKKKEAFTTVRKLREKKIGALPTKNNRNFDDDDGGCSDGVRPLTVALLRYDQNCSLAFLFAFLPL